MNIRCEKGFSLVEIALVLSLGAIVVTIVSFSVINFRNTVQYDILLNQLVESVNSSRMKAFSGRLDDSEQRTSYGVKFLDDSFIEFVGDQYEESDTRNIAYSVPLGLRLETFCTTENNGEVVFSPVEVQNGNSCTISIYKSELTDPVGNVVVGKYGVEQAS